MLTHSDGPARQPSSVQRGSVAYINQYPGDPTTPGYASKPGVERVSDPSNLPKIPSLPISFRDALPILKALDGHGVSGPKISRDGWIGGLDATYSSGPAAGVTLSLTNIMEEKITPSLASSTVRTLMRPSSSETTEMPGLSVVQQIQILEVQS
jgi:N-acetylated-alpha-linked acidic dipeptidase